MDIMDIHVLIETGRWYVQTLNKGYDNFQDDSSNIDKYRFVKFKISSEVDGLKGYMIFN